MIKVKRIHEDAKVPTLGHKDDAGLDIYCIEDFEIFHDEQRIIPTGLEIAIPKGYVGLIMPRSGLACKHRLDRRAGVIDPPFRQELKIVLVNESFKSYTFKKGDRIAQLVVVPCVTDIEEVEELDETTRGGGWGSSGR